MRLVVMAVFDSKMEAFLSPMFFPTRGVGLRIFGDAINNPDSEWAKHPADYTLFELGVFHQETGNFELHEARINLGSALELQTKNQWEDKGSGPHVTDLREAFNE